MGRSKQEKKIYIYIRAKKAEYYVRTEEPHSPSQHTSPFPVPASGVRPCAYVDAKKKKKDNYLRRKESNVGHFRIDASSLLH